MTRILLFLLFLFSGSAVGQSHYEKYLELNKGIIMKKDSLLNEYHREFLVEKDSIIINSREFLFNTVTGDLFSYWYGTPWDFNGHSKIPQQGTIACGYFVTTVLLHAGFNVPRIKWAQSASEVFIKKLAPHNLQRFHNKPVSDIVKYLKDTGPGLYLVGLDNHVGFITVKNDSIHFVHANYYEPDIGVMSQEIDSENPLKDSKYRIIGKLLTDEMVIKWLQNIPYE